MPQSKKMKRELCQHQNTCEPETRKEKTRVIVPARYRDRANQPKFLSVLRGGERKCETPPSKKPKQTNQVMLQEGHQRAWLCFGHEAELCRDIQHLQSLIQPSVEPGSRDNQRHLQMGSGMCQGLGHGSEVEPWLAWCLIKQLCHSPSPNSAAD